MGSFQINMFIDEKSIVRKDEREKHGRLTKTREISKKKKIKLDSLTEYVEKVGKSERKRKKEEELG